MQAREGRERELLQRIDDLSSARAAADGDLRRLGADAHASRAQLESASEQAAALTTELQTVRAELDDQTRARRAAEAAADAAAVERDSAAADRLRLEQALGEAAQLQAEMNTARQRADRHAETLREELAQIRSRSGDAELRFARESEARQAAERELAGIRLQNDELLQRAGRLSARVAEDQAAAAQLPELVEREASAIAARTLAERTTERLAEDLRAATERLRHSDEALQRLRNEQRGHVETAQLRALELTAQERARTRALADIAAAGSAVSVRRNDTETPLSIEAITGVILVALGIIVALLILTGVIHT